MKSAQKSACHSLVGVVVLLIGLSQSGGTEEATQTLPDAGIEAQAAETVGLLADWLEEDCPKWTKEQRELLVSRVRTELEQQSTSLPADRLLAFRDSLRTLVQSFMKDAPSALYFELMLEEVSWRIRCFLHRVPLSSEERTVIHDQLKGLTAFVQRVLSEQALPIGVATWESEQANFLETMRKAIEDPLTPFFKQPLSPGQVEVVQKQFAEQVPGLLQEWKQRQQRLSEQGKSLSRPQVSPEVRLIRSALGLLQVLARAVGGPPLPETLLAAGQKWQADERERAEQRAREAEERLRKQMTLGFWGKSVTALQRMLLLMDDGFFVFRCGAGTPWLSF
jgi:hypothetical protein